MRKCFSRAVANVRGFGHVGKSDKFSPLERNFSLQLGGRATNSTRRLLRNLPDANGHLLGAWKCTDHAAFNLSLRKFCRRNRMNAAKSGKIDHRPAARAARARTRMNIDIAKQKELGRYGLLTAGIAIVFLAGVFVGISGRNSPLPSNNQSPSIEQCTSNLLSQRPTQSPPPAELRQIVEYCYSLLHSQQLLKDFEIRKQNFLQQYQTNRILMWMVVAITISGVILAAIQLLATYKLAELNKTAFPTTDELTLKRNQIVLRSSVTGLFIVALSFAFFLVFVLYVYRIQIIDDNMMQKQFPATNLAPGELGLPKPASE